MTDDLKPEERVLHTLVDLDPGGWTWAGADDMVRRQMYKNLAKKIVEALGVEDVGAVDYPAPAGHLYEDAGTHARPVYWMTGLWR